VSVKPLEGKVAAVTGASSGIGEATALALAEAGAAVALGARRKDRLEDLAARIEAAGGKAVAIEVDVADEQSAHAFINGAKEQLGRLDILINNAGVMLLGPVEGANTDDWRQMMEVNVLGLLYCSQAALPVLRDGGQGHIVNVSSVAGRTA
jgi:NADP-dependent 3-hydroxy acid dehydrogenase YdfG